MIFISYSRQDRGYALRLATVMRAAGLSVWFDALLRTGDTWPAELARRIDESDAVVVIMSEASRRSPWVQAEVRYARRAGTPLVPVLLSGAVWRSLSHLQAEDCTAGQMPQAAFYEALRA